VADSLVDAELAGRPSHGLRLLPGYLADLEEGRLDPDAHPVVEREGAHVVARGGTVPGAHLVSTALREAAEAARQYGCCTVVMPDVRHCGRLGGYAARAAEEGCVALLTVGSLGTSDAFVSPYGAAGRWLDTNPVAFAFPAEDRPIVVDLATSATTYNAVTALKETGGALPEGVACDAAGEPTTDPRAVLDGGWALPAAGQKGFALGLVPPLLAALAGTAATTPEGGLAGGFALLLAVGERTDLAGYRGTVSASLERMARGAGRRGAVRLPGRRGGAADGIRVPARLLAELRGVGCDAA
jgi:LDH2 family malate/lactate/ureidoglycolate dehydrogenase